MQKHEPIWNRSGRRLAFGQIVFHRRTLTGSPTGIRQREIAPRRMNPAINLNGLVKKTARSLPRI